MGTQKILKTFSKKSHSAEKCSENTLFHILIHALPILIHWLGFRLQILIHALPIPIPWVGSCRLGNQSESSITSPESSANQNRALRQLRSLGLGGGPFSALGSSRLVIAYPITWGPPPPPHHRSSHSYYCRLLLASLISWCCDHPLSLISVGKTFDMKIFRSKVRAISFSWFCPWRAESAAESLKIFILQIWNGTGVKQHTFDDANATFAQVSLLVLGHSFFLIAKKKQDFTTIFLDFWKICFLSCENGRYADVKETKGIFWEVFQKNVKNLRVNWRTE